MAPAPVTPPPTDDVSTLSGFLHYWQTYVVGMLSIFLAWLGKLLWDLRASLATVREHGVRLTSAEDSISGLKDKLEGAVTRDDFAEARAEWREDMQELRRALSDHAKHSSERFDSLFRVLSARKDA